MKYKNIKEAFFIKRKNRFIAQVNIDGNIEDVHVKNTGRCEELFIPSTRVYLEKSSNPKRKTAYSLVALEKGHMMVNVDSQIPNAVVKEAILEGHPIINKIGTITKLQTEKTYKKSRFDLYYESETQKGFIEVKGVTLEREGALIFPDAPTERGKKHLNELRESLKDGYKSFVVFVGQLDVGKKFMPNWETDPEFSKSLVEAHRAGVGVLCFNCQVDAQTIRLNKEVAIELEK